MNLRLFIILGAVTAVVVAALIALTLVWSPEDTNPAVDAAVRFMNAAGQGDDATAGSLLGEELAAYVAANCPDGSVAACIDAYTPPAWGDLIAAVFRRSVPQGNTIWHVQLVATYEEEQGFAGGCIYHRMEEIGDDWLVTAWSGFVSCDDPDSRIEGLRRDNAPNRAP